MHSLRSAVVQYTNYGTGGAFELPTQSGTSFYIVLWIDDSKGWPWTPLLKITFKKSWGKQYRLASVFLAFSMLLA